MRIGIGIRQVLSNKTVDDEPLLREAGCERIFIDDNPISVGVQVPMYEQYLRGGDTLAVVELTRLGRNAEQIVQTVDRLHDQGITVLIHQEHIEPNTDLGNAFLLVCSRLAAAMRELQSQNGQGPEVARRRGRPAALTPEMQNKAQHYLTEGNGSVMEIARILHVSPATIYRYFPGRKHARKKPGAEP